jgi:hypothetical protein
MYYLLKEVMFTRRKKLIIIKRKTFKFKNHKYLYI